MEDEATHTANDPPRILFTDPTAGSKGKRTKYADVIDQYAAGAIKRAFDV